MEFPGPGPLAESEVPSQVNCGKLQGQSTSITEPAALPPELGAECKGRQGAPGLFKKVRGLSFNNQ
jgi:hypothetical protein